MVSSSTPSYSSVPGIATTTQPLHQEDAVMVVTEYFSSLDNVAGEVAFLLTEVGVRDDKISTIQEYIGKHSQNLYRAARPSPPSKSGSGGGGGGGESGRGSQANTPLNPLSNKDKQNYERVQSEFKKIEELQKEKTQLSEKLTRIITRHRERGRDEWRKVVGSDMVESYDSALLKAVETLMQNAAAAAKETTPAPSTSGGGKSSKSKSNANANGSSSSTTPSAPTEATKAFISQPSATLSLSELLVASQAASLLTATGGHPNQIGIVAGMGSHPGAGPGGVTTPIGGALVGSLLQRGGLAGFGLNINNNGLLAGLGGAAGLYNSGLLTPGASGMPSGPPGTDERSGKRRKGNFGAAGFGAGSPLAPSGSGTPLASAGAASGPPTYFDMLPPANPSFASGSAHRPLSSTHSNGSGQQVGRKKGKAEDAVPYTMFDVEGGGPGLGGEDMEAEESGEEVYCICREKSYGEMIGCDNNDCRYEWVSGVSFLRAYFFCRVPCAADQLRSV